MNKTLEKLKQEEIKNYKETKKGGGGKEQVYDKETGRYIAVFKVKTAIEAIIEKLKIEEIETLKSDVRKGKSFSEQIDDLFSDEYNPFYDLLVSATPKILRDIGLKDIPLMMRNSKVKQILTDHEEMTVDLIKKIPDAIANPLLILKSKTHPSDSVVIITDITTAKGEMIVPIRLNQKGNYYDINIGKSVETETNIVSSVYGRNVKGLLDYALEKDEVLYVSKDKEKISNFLATHGLQLPTRL